jgi:hypothetical protein
MDPLVVNLVPPTDEQLMEFFNDVLLIADVATILSLQDQGLKSMAGFNDLKLEKITQICANVRKPGGMIEDDAGNQVPSRSLQVTVLDEKRLKQF